MDTQNGAVSNAKEDCGQAVRKRYDDEGGFFFVPAFGASTEVASMEAHLRLSSAIKEAKQKQEQAFEVGVSVQPLQEVVCPKASYSGSYCASGHTKGAVGPCYVCEDAVLRARQPASFVRPVPFAENRGRQEEQIEIVPIIKLDQREYRGVVPLGETINHRTSWCEKHKKYHCVDISQISEKDFCEAHEITIQARAESEKILDEAKKSWDKLVWTERERALDVQVGGGHYKDMKIQPVEFIMANGLGFCEGNCIKYVTRWKSKGGIEDLKKARHYLDLLIEEQEENDES